MIREVLSWLIARRRGRRMARDFVTKTYARPLSWFTYCRGTDGRRLLYMIRFRSGQWPEMPPRAYVAVDVGASIVSLITASEMRRTRLRRWWECL